MSTKLRPRLIAVVLALAVLVLPVLVADGASASVPQPADRMPQCTAVVTKNSASGGVVRFTTQVTCAYSAGVWTRIIVAPVAVRSGGGQPGKTFYMPTKLCASRSGVTNCSITSSIKDVAGRQRYDFTVEPAGTLVAGPVNTVVNGKIYSSGGNCWNFIRCLKAYLYY